MAAAGDEWGARAEPVGRAPLLVSACLAGLHTRLDARARSFPTVLTGEDCSCLSAGLPELGRGTTPPGLPGKGESR
jgi:hypothetical protein